MFLDASAIVAILGGEPDGPELAGRLNGWKTGFFVSPLVLFEASASLAAKLARETGLPRDAALLAKAETAVREFVASLGAQEMSVSPDIGRKALEAAQTYSRLVDHPAQLNFGDCFAYACAKAYRIPLLYKGNDFAQTDLR